MRGCGICSNYRSSLRESFYSIGWRSRQAAVTLSEIPATNKIARIDAAISEPLTANKNSIKMAMHDAIQAIRRNSKLCLLQIASLRVSVRLGNWSEVMPTPIW